MRMPLFARELGATLFRAAVVLYAIVAVAGVVFPTEASLADTCPNKAFRTGPSASLPDCRAYEMVSPVEKNGAFINTGSVISSPEGESVGFTSNSGFAGANSNIGAETGYQASRGASGWSTVAQTQPQDEFINEHAVLDADYFDETFGNVEYNLENGKRLLLLREVSKPESDLDFYLSNPDNSRTEVGPSVPPTASGLSRAGLTLEERGYVGLSADASHVVFRDPEPAGPNQWSFGSPSALLEYAGRGNSVPMLVGVDNSGHFVNNCPGQFLGGVPNVGLFNAANNSISSDGSKIFFTDECQGELFARVDNGLADEHTVPISEPSKAECSACDTEAPEAAEFLGASEDGSKVFFDTGQPLLNESGGLFEYDFDAPEGEKVTQIAPGFVRFLEETGPPSRVQVSQDGSHVYFLSGRVLSSEPSADAAGKNAAGEPVAAGAVAQEGESNLYVFERDARYPAGHIRYVATLSESERRSELRTNVTSDGRFLVLDVKSDLTADDTTSARQVFEYDSLTGSLVRVSVGEGGYNNNGNVADDAIIPDRLQAGFEPASQPSSYSDHLSVSADGLYVFFQSGAALTPNALNNVLVGTEGRTAQNIYEYHEGNVYLISDGQDTSAHDSISNVRLLTTDLSGRDVFFETTDQLVPQDTDSNKDVYDARIDGGFPAPVQPVACSGDACQGSLSGAPVLLSPGSEFQAGGDNLPATAPAKPAVKPKAMTRAQQLAKALAACRRQPKKKHAACEKQARKKYGAVAKVKAKKATRRAK